MKQVVHSLLLLAVGLAGFCGVITDASADHSPTADPAAIEAELERRIDKLQADWNSGDMEAYLAAYWNDPGLSMMTGGTALRGWDTVARLFRGTWTTEAGMGDFAASNVAIRVLDGRTAIASGEFRHVFPDETVQGIFTHVWRQLGDGWLIVHEHTSRVPPRD